VKSSSSTTACKNQWEKKVEYLKLRGKNYAAILIGLLNGFAISKIMGESSGISTTIIIIAIGLALGDLLVFTKWFRKKPQA